MLILILDFELGMQMVRELDEILRQQMAQPANSCNSENGPSFLDKVIFPLYEVVAAVSIVFVISDFRSSEVFLPL